MIPEGFAQVTLKWSLAGTTTTASTVFGVSNVTDLNALDLATAVGSQIEDWSDLSPNVSNVWTIDLVHVKLGPDETGPQAELSLAFGGSNVSAPAASNLAYLLKKNSTLGGRRGIGRTFIPGVPEPAVDGAGVLAAGFQSSLSGAGSQLLSLLDDAFVPMVLLHSQPRPPAEPIVLPDPSPVVTWSCQPVCATQRRRMRRS